MDMIERVARALCKSGGFDPNEIMANDGRRWRYYEPQARAAIEAMMEPTEEMVAAGRPVDHMALRSVDSIYQAMIRAALEESK